MSRPAAIFDESTRPKNLYIIGAQCTGKTTIVNALRDHFNREGSRIWRGKPISPPAFIVELARTVLVKHDFRAEDITSSPTRSLQLQNLILQAQAEAERAVSDVWFVSDRSGLGEWSQQVAILIKLTDMVVIP